MAFSPAPKSPGNLIRSQDWNEAMDEVVRLESAKVSMTGGNVNGVLSVSALNVGTLASPNRALTVRGTGGTYLNVSANNGTHEVLLGADNAGGIVSTMTNHDLQLRAGGNVTRLTVKADGNVGIGTLQASQRLTIGSGNILLPNASAGINGNLYFGGITDAGETGLRLFGGVVNGITPAGFIDVRTIAPSDGLRIRVDTTNGSTERMRVTAGGNVGIGTINPGEPLEVNGRIKAGALTIGPWPANPNGYMFFGTNALNQGNAANYALLQGAAAGDLGVTFLNSPANIRFRISNADKMVLANNGQLQIFGPLVVQQAHTIKVGVPSPTNRYGNDGIRGEPNLWLDAAGTVFIKPGFQTPTGFDIAERFKTVAPVQAGQVVIFDAPAEAVTLCDRAYDSRVIGIASAEPAFILGMDPEQVPIALCGRVPCQVDADIAPIAVGDLLTTSPTRGHAQKVTEPEKALGAILGKALGALEVGKGTIPVLVLLH